MSLPVAEAAASHRGQGTFRRERVLGGDGTLLVLESKPDAEGYVHRITVNPLNEKRTLVLHERKARPRAGQRLVITYVGELPEVIRAILAQGSE